MRRIICILLTIALSSSLLATSSFAAGKKEKQIDNNVINETNIMNLFDERQKLFFEKTVDISKLNEIDLKLSSLGVDFLTNEEVSKQFPEAKAQREKALKGDTVSAVATNQQVIAAVATPTSNVNTWASYRYSNQLYNGKYYNVQKLVAQPISSNSGLWENGERQVSFSVNWKAGVTNLITSLAWSGAGSIASVPVTVYDALSSVWDGLKTVSDVDPSDVTYKWQTQTTAVFAYVRLESQSDNYQWLSHISTKCITSVGYLAAIESWRQNGSGTWVLYPCIKSSSKYLYHTPKDYNSTTKALWAYNNVIGGTAYHDAISDITISGPESKTVQTIYPCYPQFPLHCE
ncbi:MAG: hypothetical protein N2489_08000 [Clostridia bacterium]|nr:hypothetical protein [Clostridia bacterium]